MSYGELEKVYDPTKVENKWYAFWEENGLFHADNTSPKEPFTIMIPPPNVTGMLTIGHILNNTVQDLLIRWKKMQGYETLWLPGTDHAGIATQNRVESALRSEGLDRHALGREKFLERVWAWRKEYGGIILKQLRKLGSACDWQRERFTMDEGLSRAVQEVFVRLYEKGWLYRGQRLINWCPQCRTALADEEVSYEEQQGHYWSIAYPLKDGSGEIVVATTRPETMLGDTAVAVHPQDHRYKSHIGKSVLLPLMNREIPIIADEHADPEKGSGAVKITPAHDFDDFEVGLRHRLEQIPVIAADGTMNENAGAYAGLDRFEARERIVSDLEKLGLLRGVEDRIVPMPRCYRSDDIIEPYLSSQWFVKMKPLAEPAIQAVRSGRIRFYPKHWEETYFHWMENIRDWCISRQIWWGHRIPVWYCECGEIIVARQEPETCPDCGSANLRQDEDVLDTWFSSWLWPFSTLGWPDETPDLKKFFPGNTLATGPDIIFFWVARMIMASLEFMGDVPFADVYFNGMIRDKDNRKMSKSLGNSPDPLWLIEGADAAVLGEFARNNPSYKNGIPAYGADAVRMTMVYLTPLGGDIRFDHTMVELGQKFSNKLWNAARFVLMNLDERQAIPALGDIEPTDMELADRWILSRLNRMLDEVDAYLTEFRLNDATHAIYSFVWDEFCDWYIELAKTRLYNGRDVRGQHIARAISVHVLDIILRALHPFMPFITEEIWQALPKIGNMEKPKSIMLAAYPRSETGFIDKNIDKKMLLIQQVVGVLRNIRGEMNVPPGKEAELVVNSSDEQKLAVIRANEIYVTQLARLSSIRYGEKRPEAAASAVMDGVELFMPLADLID
ncbi:valine--tRNA ligase, partial [candidate division KSB1 bacterium RBG_16_48_16]